MISSWKKVFILSHSCVKVSPSVYVWPFNNQLSSKYSNWISSIQGCYHMFIQKCEKIFLPQIARSLSMSIIKWVKFHTISIKIVTGMLWYLINLHIHIGKTWIFKLKNIQKDGRTHEFEACPSPGFWILAQVRSFDFYWFLLWTHGRSHFCVRPTLIQTYL